MSLTFTSLMIQLQPEMRFWQIDWRTVAVGLMVLLLNFQRVRSLNNGQLYISNSCQWSYQIQEMYDITMKDIGPVCPESLQTGPSDRSLFPSSSYQTHVTPLATGRAVEINWEYIGCYLEFYMKFTVSLQPDFRIDATRKKCIRFMVKRLSSVMSVDPVRLHFNCLRINSKDLGTLTVQSYGNSSSENFCSSALPEHSDKRFNLGCDIHGKEVRLENCLTIQFSRLENLEFQKTSIVLEGPGDCKRTFSGTKISRFNDPAILYLPVHGNGTYHIYIHLVCSSSGEIEERTIQFNTNIANADTCPAYNSTTPSECQDTTTTKAIAPKTQNSTQRRPRYNQLYTVITVVSGIGIVAFVVIIVFIHRRKQQNASGQDVSTTQEDMQELRQLCHGNGCPNNTNRDISETTELREEETIIDEIK